MSIFTRFLNMPLLCLFNYKSSSLTTGYTLNRFKKIAKI